MSKEKQNMTKNIVLYQLNNLAKFEAYRTMSMPADFSLFEFLLPSSLMTLDLENSNVRQLY